MGWFDDSEEVVVSSVPYNLAGPLHGRASYLKTTISAGVLDNVPSMGNHISSSYLNGPGIDQRSFYRWSRNNFSQGKLTGALSSKRTITAAQIEPLLPAVADHTITVNAAFVDDNIAHYHLEKQILANHPSHYLTDWTHTYDNPSGAAVVTFEDASTYNVNIGSIDESKDVVVCYYTYVNTIDPNLSYEAMLVYIQGTGNANYDAFIQELVAVSNFFPVIECRRHNRMVYDEAYGGWGGVHYKQMDRAYKKATGQHFEQLLADIEANEAIHDIDHAYLVHGVELNTQSKCGQRYVYEFLRDMAQYQETTLTELNDWIAWMENLETEDGGIIAWEAAQSDPQDPLYGTPRPGRGSLHFPAYTKLEVQGAAIPDYKVGVSWLNITETIYAGSPRRKGTFWMEVGPNLNVPQVAQNTFLNLGALFQYGQVHRVYINWQFEDGHYRQLDCLGLGHQNYIYGGERTSVGAPTAVVDPHESGFILPLHYDTLKKLSLVESSQLASENRIMVFNCYTIHVRRWYESTIFQLIASIVLGVIVALIFPAGIGLLGSHMAVGAQMGFTGVSALVAGAAVNAVAATILVQVIQGVTGDLFGGALGQVLGTIVAMLAVNAVSSAFQTGQFAAFNFSEMMKAENLLKMTNSVAKLANAHIKGDMAEIQEEMTEAYDEYEGAMNDLEDWANEMLGTGLAELDPLRSTQPLGHFNESSDTFLNRTLMTGDDIAEITFRMIDKYPELSLALPKHPN